MAVLRPTAEMRRGIRVRSILNDRRAAPDRQPTRETGVDTRAWSDHVIVRGRQERWLEAVTVRPA
jgi:hypothetical protein